MYFWQVWGSDARGLLPKPPHTKRWQALTDDAPFWKIRTSSSSAVIGLLIVLSVPAWRRMTCIIFSDSSYISVVWKDSRLLISPVCHFADLSVLSLWTTPEEKYFVISSLHDMTYFIHNHNCSSRFWTVFLCLNCSYSSLLPHLSP